MSLQVKNNAVEKSDASAVLLYDTTGIFTGDNPTGWENSTTGFITDAVSATATIFLTNPTTLLVTTNSVVIDVFPTLPNFVNNPYEVSALAMGYTSGVIPDGIITVEYNVVVTIAGVDVTFNSSKQKLMYANVCCCVKSLFGDVNPESCDCESEEVQDALYAWALLKSLQRAIRGNKMNKAMEILKSLQQICANSNCTNC